VIMSGERVTNWKDAVVMHLKAANLTFTCRMRKTMKACQDSRNSNRVPPKYMSSPFTASLRTKKCGCVR